MKALSVKQPWADRIVRGKKKVEYRSWSTTYRGDLLICSTKTPDKGGESLPLGMALGVVKLSDIRSDKHGGFEWILSNPRKIKSPFPVRGKQGLFDVPYEG